MSITFIIIGIILALAGFAGSILPVLPGPPLSYLALIALSFAKDWEPFSPLFLIIMAAITLIVMVLDYIIPLMGAARSGASRAEIYLSMVGMFVGIFFIPPWGIILGAFAGAILGEMLEGKKGRDLWKVGWAIFIGNILSTGLKIAFSLVVIFFLIKELF